MFCFQVVSLHLCVSSMVVLYAVCVGGISQLMISSLSNEFHVSYAFRWFIHISDIHYLYSSYICVFLYGLPLHFNRFTILIARKPQLYQQVGSTKTKKCNFLWIKSKMSLCFLPKMAPQPTPELPSKVVYINMHLY